MARRCSFATADRSLSGETSLSRSPELERSSIWCRSRTPRSRFSSIPTWQSPNCLVLFHGAQRNQPIRLRLWFGGEQCMPDERTDGTTQPFGHCLIGNPEFVRELLCCTASGNVVVSHPNSKHERFSLWLAQAVPRTSARIRRIVHPNEFKSISAS